MFEMYEDVEDFIRKVRMDNKVSVKFIDLMDDDLIGYENEQKILNQGYPLPITFIEKQPAFAGQVDQNRLYAILKNMSR